MWQGQKEEEKQKLVALKPDFVRSFSLSENPNSDANEISF